MKINKSRLKKFKIKEFKQNISNNSNDYEILAISLQNWTKKHMSSTS